MLTFLGHRTSQSSCRTSRGRADAAIGVAVKRCTFEHTGAGLRALVKALQRADADAIGMERPDGPVVDALLRAGVTVFVIARNQLKNLRSRYGSAGNMDDRFAVEAGLELCTAWRASVSSPRTATGAPPGRHPAPTELLALHVRTDLTFPGLAFERVPLEEFPSRSVQPTPLEDARCAGD